MATESKSSLQHALIPRDVSVFESLPKNSHGKVLRPQLKLMATNARGDCCPEMEAAAQ
jgi:acyl-coenzyme A synthetase/AMP-(fatty) acid ligase